MDEMTGVTPEDRGPPVRILTADQRRVFGALLEKAFTTPDQYPLTIKSLAAACSQKSNRDPVREYSEDEVADALHDLQGLGLVAEVHTDGGRTPRYRHLARKQWAWSEPQLAVMTELWLRGRQQMGELRTRASRMVEIPTQEALRAVLQPLLDDGSVRATGSLDRRGVEVDHGFYPADEAPAVRSEVVSPPVSSPGTSPLGPALQDLLERLEHLESRVQALERAAALSRG